MKRKGICRRLTEIGWFILLTALLMIGFAGCASTGRVSAKAEPGVYCEVKSEPNPILMGKHSCIVRGVNERGIRYANPVSYNLVKTPEGNYGFYYAFRPAKGAGLEGWQGAVIDGDAIHFIGRDETPLYFRVEEGKVFFELGGKKTQMD